MTPDKKEKLEAALQLIQERRDEVPGLDAPIMLIRYVLGQFDADCYYFRTDACDCTPGKCMYKTPPNNK